MQCCPRAQERAAWQWLRRPQQRHSRGRHCMRTGMMEGGSWGGHCMRMCMMERGSWGGNKLPALALCHQRENAVPGLRTVACERDLSCIGDILAPMHAVAHSGHAHPRRLNWLC